MWNRQHRDEVFIDGEATGPDKRQSRQIERAETMQSRVEYLASPELEGRAPGNPGGRLARAYVEAPIFVVPR